MPFIGDEDDLPPEVVAALASSAVEPTSESGPPPSSDAPGDGSEPQPEPDGTEEAPAEPSFDPKHRQDFQGLLYLGALTKTVEIYGHEFEIRTINTDEILQVGLFIKEFNDTIATGKAYATAVVAAAVVNVDGRPLPKPYQDSDEVGDTPLRHRFRVVNQWYPHVIDVLYSEYLALESRAAEVFEALGKA
jgi:hypothetical protein